MSATPAASARQVLEQADVRVEMGADAALEEGVSLRAQPLKLALVRLVVAIGLLVAWQLVAGRLVDKFWISLIQFSAGQFDTAVFAALFVLMGARHPAKRGPGPGRATRPALEDGGEGLRKAAVGR